MRFVLSILLLLAPSLIAQNSLRGPGSQPVAPYRVIGNIYYVGAVNISAHIIVTPEGLILLDTGTVQMWGDLQRNIQQLGHRLEDVKILLSSHAHWDHVENHAAMQQLTGAKIVALGEDAAALASGIDRSALGGEGWRAARVDRVLEDGDWVTLGGVTLRAHHTPGHTPGCTTWTMRTEEKGTSYRVVFVGGTSINEGVTLVGNERHPGIAEDYARTFRVLGQLRPDVFLAQHPAMYGMAEKMERMQTGGSNPFVDPEGFRSFVIREEGRFLKQLREEKSRADRP